MCNVDSLLDAVNRFGDIVNIVDDVPSSAARKPSPSVSAFLRLFRVGVRLRTPAFAHESLKAAQIFALRGAAIDSESRERH
jgi:hypothetical protein